MNAEAHRPRRCSPDEARIEASLARITMLHESQESLTPEDGALVASILSGKLPVDDPVDDGDAGIVVRFDLRLDHASCPCGGG